MRYWTRERRFLRRDRMAELKPCPCIHACDIQANAIGETLAYCELTAEWMNVSLGDCSGNCDSEEVNNG